MDRFIYISSYWQVLHSVRNDAHAFTSFVESVERPARSLPAIQSLLDELDEEGGMDTFLPAGEDNVCTDLRRDCDTRRRFAVGPCGACP